MRVTVSRSGTSRTEEEFAVAITAFDGRGDNASSRPAEAGDDFGDAGAHGVMHLRVAHDAFLEARAPGLELRLDQCDQLCRQPRKRERRWQHQLERDEGN